MTQSKWTAVDTYITDALISSDPVLDVVLQTSDAAGLPSHHVSPNQGKFLMLLALMQQARNILEIGTLGGYSTIWLARALPSEGRLITLESNPKHAEVAHHNIDQAGFTHLVEIRVGKAVETLAKLKQENGQPFDLIFIDADKPNNPDYLAWALQLSHQGSVIIADNVIRDGAVIEANSTDPNVQGIRRFNEMLKSEPRVTATAIQTVGSKGYDGFAIALVTSGEEQDS
jgi:predicted O-methyltransferase YrrM